MSAAAPSGSIAQGQSGTATITIARGGSFGGPVALSLEGAPTGLTGSFSPSAIPSGSTTSTLTLSAAAATAPGTYSVTIRATGTSVADATTTLGVTVVAGATPAIAVAVNPTSASVQAGASASVTANVTRSGGFTGPVTLAVTGAPAGVTATVTPNPATGATATIALAAAGSTAPGTYNLTITGTGTGVAAQSATLALTVTAAATKSVSLAFCAEDAPVWMAKQDGSGGTWTRVTPDAANTFTFQLASTRGAVAYVTQVSGLSVLSVIDATAAELAGTTVIPCEYGTRTVSGTATGLAASDFGSAALGVSTTTFTGAAPTFQLKAPSTPRDFAASRMASSGVVNKIILRRGLNPANGSTLPTLDFNAAEAFAPVSGSATISNAGTDPLYADVWLLTSTGPVNSFATTQSWTGATGTFYGIPDAQLASGDLHRVQVVANASVYNTRFITFVSRSVGNRSGALGATLTDPTIGRASGSQPYLRMTAQLPAFAEYDQVGSVAYTQTGASQVTRVRLFTTAAAAASGGYTLTIPDLSGVSGWNNAWGLQSGVSTNWTIFESGGGFPMGVPGRLGADGQTAIGATRTGTIAAP